MRSTDPLTDDLPAHHSADAIHAHPRFASARRAFVEAILGLYDDNPFLSRLLVEAGRSIVFFTILCLHAAYDEGDRATWPTMGLIQVSTALFGVSSARRIHDLVARLIETGYLTSAPAPSDRRARILIPTDRMLAHDRDWLAANYVPLEIMFPDPGYGPPIGRDPVYQKAHRVVGRTMFSRASQLMADNPVMMLFMSHEGGIMILMKLMQREGPGSGAEAQQPVSYAEIGDRFGVSRTHVRTILRKAEEAGLMARSGGGVVLAKPLVAAFDRFVADTMAAHDLMYRMTMQGLGRAGDVSLQPSRGVQ